MEIRVVFKIVRVELLARRFRRNRAPRLALLFKREVIVAAQPQAQLESQSIQRAKERLFSLGRPIWDIEPIRIPGLVNAKIVVLAHPARLQAAHVARDALPTEIQAFLHHLRIVDLLVAHIGQPIGPPGQHDRFAQAGSYIH